MSIAEYIRDLNRLKKLSVDRWGNLSTLERQVFESTFEWLTDHLEIKRGEIVPDEQLTALMDEFLQATVDIVNNNKLFQGKVSSFLVDLKTIQANNKKFHITTNNFNIEAAGVTQVQKMVVDEILNQFTGNGLNRHFAAPLRDGIFRNILGGAGIKEVKQVLQAYIIGGKDESGKLGRYLEQTAVQAVDSYTGAINQKLKQEFTFTGYIISGSLIATSSKQCIYAVETSEEGYLPFEEWEKILDIARENKKAPLIDGTNIDNLPLNKLHWGCRHDFTPIIIEKPKKKEKAVAEKKTVAQKNEERLAEIEVKIRQQNFESAGIVKGGNTLLFKDGEASQVVFTDEEVAMMKGAILTHNHPSSRSFSPADISLFFQAKMDRLRAVGRLYDYDIQRTKETARVTRERAVRVYREAEADIEAEFSSLIDKGEMTIDHANQFHHHRVMEIVAKQLNLKYERTIHK